MLWSGHTHLCSFGNGAFFPSKVTHSLQLLLPLLMASHFFLLAMLISGHTYLIIIIVLFIPNAAYSLQSFTLLLVTSPFFLPVTLLSLFSAFYLYGFHYCDLDMPRSVHLFLFQLVIFVCSGCGCVFSSGNFSAVMSLAVDFSQGFFLAFWTPMTHVVLIDFIPNFYCHLFT